MLPTDELVRKATTTTTNLATLIPQLWASQLEVILRRRAVLEQSLVVNTDLLVPNAGDRVFIPALPDVGPASALTEGTDIVIEALTNSTSITMTPSEFGKALGITRKALDRIKYDGMAAIMDRLGYSMSMKIETMIAALYNATATADLGNSQEVFGGGSVLTPPTLYPNGHATGTIVTTDVFSATMLSTAIAKLQQFDNVPFDDGNYNLYLTPDSYQSLIMDPNIRNDIHFGDPSMLMRGVNGYKAHLYGCNLIISNYVISATENTIPVNNNLLVAPRWAGIAWKRRTELTIDPTLYDFGRRRQFGVTADFDIKLLHADRVLVIKSAKQF